LPSIAPSLPKDATLKQLSSLMADLCALSSVLHSLQVKLAVAAQKKRDLSSNLSLSLSITFISREMVLSI